VFSPDGKKIAIFWNNGDLGNGAWLISLENLSTRFLYPHANPIGWSADRTSIFIHPTAAESTGREILQIKLDDPKDPKSIVTLPARIRSGSVSPDGRKIIVSLTEEKSDVWLMKDFDPEAVRPQ
jgi:hypothetical protein